MYVNVYVHECIFMCMGMCVYECQYERMDVHECLGMCIRVCMRMRLSILCLRCVHFVCVVCTSIYMSTGMYMCMCGCVVYVYVYVSRCVEVCVGVFVLICV